MWKRHICKQLSLSHLSLPLPKKFSEILLVKYDQCVGSQWRKPGSVAEGGGGERGAAFYISFMYFFLNYFEQSLLCYITYLLILNHLTMLPNAQAQSCGNGPRHLVYALVYSREYNRDLILLFIMSRLRSLLFSSLSLPYLNRSHSACECSIGTRQCYASDSHNLGESRGAPRILQRGGGLQATSGGLEAKPPVAGG